MAAKMKSLLLADAVDVVSGVQMCEALEITGIENIHFRCVQSVRRLRIQGSHILSAQVVPGAWHILTPMQDSKASTDSRLRRTCPVAHDTSTEA